MVRQIAQNRLAFQQVANERWEDANALFAAGGYNAAYYLLGYVVECALKACIAKQTQAGDFPPRNTNNSHYVHDLERLIITAG